MAEFKVPNSPLLTGDNPLTGADVAGIIATDPLSQGAQHKQNLQDDTEFAAEVKRHFDDDDKARKGLEKMWKECIAFIEGIQYVIADLQTPVWLNVQANGPKGTERVIDNSTLFVPARRLHGQLTKPSYAPFVSALTDMPEDYDAARVGQALCRNFYHNLKVPKIKRQQAWWHIVCGCSWIETFYDPEDRGGRAGMMLRSPFQVYPDARFVEWEKCRHATVTEVASRSDILDRYAKSYEERTGEKLESRLPEKLSVKTNVWMPDPAVRPGGDATGIMSPPPAVKGTLMLVRYYERPSAKYKKGRFGVLVDIGGSFLTLKRADLETPLGHSIPVQPFGYWNRPWELIARSPVSLCIGLQRLANYSTGRWYEHIKRWAAGYLMLDTLSGVTRGSITNQPDVIRHNPGHEPKFVFPPFGNLNGYVAFRNAMIQAIEQIMNLPPLNEKMPKGAKAAKTLEILREFAEEAQEPMIEDTADNWSEVWKQMIGWMQMFPSNATLSNMVGRDKQGIIEHFKAGSIPDEWEDRLLVSVDTGGHLPTGRLARMQTILEMSRKDQLFGKPGTPEHARQLKQALGFDPGYLESETDLDRAIAQQENTVLKGGEALSVHKYDDDETHIAEHLTYIKQLTVQAEPEELLQIIMQHIDKHRAQLADKHKSMAPAAQQNTPAATTPFGAQGQPNVAPAGPQVPMGATGQ